MCGSNFYDTDIVMICLTLILQEFERLDKKTGPEIMRCSISTVILQMLSIGITNVSKFDFLDPPPQDAVEDALRQLHLLGNIYNTLDLQ
jgi:ATP-dependent RNA helicase DHX33